jgi:enoyl-CoA hydratase/carnithine racemase
LSYKTIRYGLDDAVATITLNRPERLNALNEILLTEFSGALDRSLAEGARSVLVTAEGRAFSSGADLNFDGNGEARTTSAWHLKFIITRSCESSPGFRYPSSRQSKVRQQERAAR